MQAQALKSIQIGSRLIGQNEAPFIVAELSGNHHQSLDKALKLIELAAQAGAHAVKLQTYTPDSLTIDSSDPDFLIQDPNSLWNNRKLYELFQEAYTPYEWHEALFKRCEELGLICFSTPFDEAGVDFLEGFNPPCYKIASFENHHFSLIRKVIQTQKPIIISLGLCSLEDVDELVRFLDREGAKDVILLKCTSTYPATPKDCNVRSIPFLAERFKLNIGLSDHTLGVGVALASVALGACMVEKHFTDDRSLGGVDAAFSLEPNELKTLVEESARAWESLGEPSFSLSAQEKKSLQFRRSIYVIQDIRAGEPFTEENIRVIRPGHGLHPREWEQALRSQASKDLKRGQALSSTDLA